MIDVSKLKKLLPKGWKHSHDSMRSRELFHSPSGYICIGVCLYDPEREEYASWYKEEGRNDSYCCFRGRSPEEALKQLLECKSALQKEKEIEKTIANELEALVQRRLDSDDKKIDK